ncbi:MAG: J domain-containing protein [Actinobacteria bacterium]|nr:MAG: J domain-containing protein [Actinomycetota bacterium]
MATGTEPTADRELGDLYAVLGLRPDASRQEIEAAYRRAALETGYEDQAWRAVREAYEVLHDPERRARYDTTRDGFRAPRPPAKKSHNPIDRLLPGLPHGWRVAIDWVVTIAGAVAIVLAIKAWVVNPYRIPSSSMSRRCTARCRRWGARQRPRIAYSRTASSTTSATRSAARSSSSRRRSWRSRSAARRERSSNA